MATLFNSFFRPVDSSSNVLSAAKLYFYSAGTSTLAKTYSDIGLTVTNANPVVADAGGLFSSIYLDATTQYKVILKDSNDATIQTIDPITSLTVSAVNSLVVSATVSGLVTQATVTAALGYTPGNPAGSLTTFLTSAVALTSTASYFSGPSTGTIGASGQVWYLQGEAFVADFVGSATFYMEISNGTSPVDNTAVNVPAGGSGQLVSSRVITLSAPTNFTLRARDGTSVSGQLYSSVDGGTTNYATSITAIRLK